MDGGSEDPSPCWPSKGKSQQSPHLSGQVCPSQSIKGRKKFSGLLTTKENSPNLWADRSPNSLYFWQRPQTKKTSPMNKEWGTKGKNSPHFRAKNAPWHFQKNPSWAEPGRLQAQPLASASPSINCQQCSVRPNSHSQRWGWKKRVNLWQVWARSNKFLSIQSFQQGPWLLDLMAHTWQWCVHIFPYCKG